ncbi:acireductone synthase [Hydrogenothermus marinus]|uniref:Enolase-phosphatase E1 n=1 Tax=Hydrogenothermus marinus TaxID=133270 RepID=A0A3M0BQX2_9AQUI|nr:acireductone synthase [Hydrogenothermus marinus]RMA97228.1 acireductone synthase [Hydrogenothermus marinus]
MIKAILLDIEGTVSPISFVKDVMFPYSMEKMENYIKNNKEKVKHILDKVREIEGKNLTDEEVIKTLKRWIDEDKKIDPLKEIQGYIWKEGFETGKLKAPIYKDAYEKMKQWKDKYKLYIYSSGSVNAQKLFFSYTEYGNILDWFSGHFDLKIGSKKEKSSYEKIAKEIGLKPEKILFLSDNPDEIKAAKEAGLEVIKVSRPEDVPYLENFPYKQIKSFEEIDL